MYLLQADTIKETAHALSAFSGLDLIIVAVLIIAVVLIWKFLPKWVEHKSEVKMHEINKQNEQMEMETNALVKETSNRLERLETVISELSNKGISNQITEIDKKVDSIIEDRIIEGKKLNTLGKEVLKLRVYDENNPVLDRLEAFNEYIKLGGNGNCRKVATELILYNKELWCSVLNNDKNQINDLDNYYKENIKDIKTTLSLY
jgi:hypothetical protein